MTLPKRDKVVFEILNPSQQQELKLICDQWKNKGKLSEYLTEALLEYNQRVSSLLQLVWTIDDARKKLDGVIQRAQKIQENIEIRNSNILNEKCEAFIRLLSHPLLFIDHIVEPNEALAKGVCAYLKFCGQSSIVPFESRVISKEWYWMLWENCSEKVPVLNMFVQIVYNNDLLENEMNALSQFYSRGVIQAEKKFKNLIKSTKISIFQSFAKKVKSLIK